MALPTIDAAPAPTAAVSIPPLVRRNTLLLALAQAFAGAGQSMVYSLGPIMVVGLLGSSALAGLGLSIVGGSRFLIAYPIGKLTDTYGRKVGMMLGIGLGVLGSVVMAGAMLWQSFELYVIGMLFLGVGTSAAHQLRVAAADMYPPSRRAEGVGLVLSGSVVGVIGGPGLVYLAHALAPSLGVPPLSLSWVLVPSLAVPGLVVLTMIHPDPKDIGANLSRYYPGYSGAVASHAQSGGRVSILHFLRDFRKRTATACIFAAQGMMAIVMVTTSLVLHAHGHGLPAISASLALHSIGMFGFSFPIGRLTDVIGRKPLMLGGLLIEAVGALLVPFTSEYWSVTLGTFLVGLGWSCLNIATTALVADTSPPEERGRAVGTIDTFGGLGAVALPLVTGGMAATLGLGSTGALAIALGVPGFVMLFGLREPRPGVYD